MPVITGLLRRDAGCGHQEGRKPGNNGASLEARLYAEQTITKTIRTPINFIVHTLQEVNDGLSHGRYFFMDVAEDGIALYKSDDTELHQPKPKTPA